MFFRKPAKCRVDNHWGSSGVEKCSIECPQASWSDHLRNMSGRSWMLEVQNRLEWHVMEEVHGWQSNVIGQ